MAKMAKNSFRTSNPQRFATVWGALTGALASHMPYADDRKAARAFARTLAEELEQEGHTDGITAIALVQALPLLGTADFHHQAPDDVRRVLRDAFASAQDLLDEAETLRDDTRTAPTTPTSTAPTAPTNG